MSYSIIMPTYQEEKSIASSLNALFLAIHQAKINPELIIVDSSPNELTTNEVLECARKAHYPVRILKQTQKTYAGKARNIGAKAALYEELVFIDAGVYCEEAWFEKVLKVRTEQKVDIVWGKLSYDPKTLFERSYLRSFVRANYSRRDTNNFFITKTKYWDIGGLNESVHSGEDLEFFEKIDHLKLDEGYSNALAYYRHFPQSTKAILRKWISYTSDNVVIGQARAKFIFVGFEILTLLIVIIGGCLNLGLGLVSLMIWLSIRFLFQIQVAKRPFKHLAEIPLTLYLILVFDLTRACGLIKGLMRLSKKHKEPSL